jgi:hypothetical protein
LYSIAGYCAKRSCAVPKNPEEISVYLLKPPLISIDQLSVLAKTYVYEEYIRSPFIDVSALSAIIVVPPVPAPISKIL